MIICAGKQEVFDFAKTIGIGLIDSAYGLTKLCIENKPESLLFIGSAGSYGNNKIFDIIESSCSSNIETGFWHENCYTPISNKSCSSFISNDEIIVNSSNYITTNKEISSKFIENNICIENMEFHSLVLIANKFNIPIKGIFIITNYTNKDAHKDFIKNHKEAMCLLVDYLKRNNYIR
jgi:nucleoside phosphorylase